MLKLLVAKETAPGETRVSGTPDTCKRLIKDGFSVQIESGAGEAAGFTDAAYTDAGASVVSEADSKSAWSTADVVTKVAAPSTDEAARLKSGALLVGFASAHSHAESIKVLRDRSVTFAAMELIPRISRAQGMDALSSQASIGGYKAALLAASTLDKYFPLMMTAAGTIQPARVVILGAGVAGLQAIATCKRLGAVVEVSDVRPQVKEQVASLGGRFIDVPIEGAGEGGYAKELTAEQLEKQKSIVRSRIVAADAVITTALVPGRPAPKLVTDDMVIDMRPGSVIIDMAVEQGGNCTLSEAGKTVVKHGVKIVGPLNLPASLPADASLLYARNVHNLLTHLCPKAVLVLDLEDEITNGALLTHAAEIRHAPTKAAIEG
ncbi:MAG: hypothetical protein RJA70_1166 [Pseudomonadota bacterium]|jgi:NAD(P) transhydrogenase subunit alpha